MQNMENTNSQALTAEFRVAKNNDQRTEIFMRAIAALSGFEQNPDEAFKGLLESKNQEVTTLSSQLAEKDAEIGNLNTQLLDAQDIAKKAVVLANEKTVAGPKKPTVKVDGKKYEVVFGVDGLTKDELAADVEKCAVLIKKGSQALELKED